ncbi:MAG: ATP-grasp domain-containing protein [Candidatus Magasanikbacteria bacterium]
MNLYEFEGKKLFRKYDIATPQGVVVRRDDDIEQAYRGVPSDEVVVKAQVLSGKRGKNDGIKFCSTLNQVKKATSELFDRKINDQYVAAVLIEEQLPIREEHYLSITYDTSKKQPMLIYSKEGGVDIESVPKSKVEERALDIRSEDLELDIPYSQKLWNCFKSEDARLVEINPLVKTKSGNWVAADSKVALDDDAMWRHKEREFEPRTMMGRPPTEREKRASEIDQGSYRGTAGKYTEMDGNIALLFSGGGASISSMDSLIEQGLQPANYTEYSGNPPREKVRELTKVVLSKPDLKGLWIAGGVANFTNVKETFLGIVDTLEEFQPDYPIVVRRAGPKDKEGLELMRECAEKNGLDMKLFGKDTSMDETAQILADMIK